MAVSITKQSITLAFFTLLERKPYKKIKVSDVTDEAGVNRMTFYYHFKDIDDLVIKKVEETVLDICKKAKLSGDCSSAYLDVFLTAERNGELVKKIVPEFDMRRLISFLSPLARKIAEHSVELRVGSRISSEIKKTLIHSVGCCMVGTFVEWLSSDMKDDPRELVKGQIQFLDAALLAVSNK